MIRSSASWPFDSEGKGISIAEEIICYVHLPFRHLRIWFVFKLEIPRLLAEWRKRAVSYKTTVWKIISVVCKTATTLLLTSLNMPEVSKQSSALLRPMGTVALVNRKWPSEDHMSLVVWSVLPSYRHPANLGLKPMWSICSCSGRKRQSRLIFPSIPVSLYHFYHSSFTRYYH